MRIMLTHLLCLSSLLCLTAITFAQSPLPSKPLRVEIGMAKQSGKGNLAYGAISFDVFKAPSLGITPFGGPTLGIYAEMADRVGGHANVTNPQDALQRFDSKGITATWGLPFSFQAGVGVGSYTTRSQSSSSIAALSKSGTDGKVFARWGMPSTNFFAELATIFPATKRFQVTQISLGMRF
jgi:hypothetical protein